MSKQKNKGIHRTEKNPKQISSSPSKYWILAAILVVTLIVFSNTLNNDFTNWDDNKNVTENADITSFSGKNVHTIFINQYVGMYIPITMISYAIDYKIGDGFNPHVFHRTNLILHLLNVILVFFLIQLITERMEITVIVTFLFAIHPMNNQTVAWVSTRSLLLYAFFFLASLVSYLYYIKKEYSWKFLTLSLFLFLLSLLSKSQAMTLPFVLLLLDYLFSRKFTVKQLIEKLPFFVLSLVFGIITLHFREIDAGGRVIDYTLFEKILFIPFSLVVYVFRSIAPVSLSAYYPYPVKTGLGLPFEYYGAPLLILLLGWIIYKAKTYRKELLFGFLFFLCTILVVIHVVSINSGITPERYAYISYIGLFYLIGQAYVWISDNRDTKVKSFKPYIATGLVVFIVALCFVTRSRNEVWKNSISLFDDVILKHPDAAFAYNNRGTAKYVKKQLQDALKDFNKAIELDSKSVEAYYNSGLVKGNLGDQQGALSDFSKAIELSPKYADTYCNRGAARANLGDMEGALSDFSKTIELDPKYALAYHHRGLVKSELGDPTGAAEDYRKAIALNPNLASLPQ